MENWTLFLLETGKLASFLSVFTDLYCFYAAGISIYDFSFEKLCLYNVGRLNVIFCSSILPASAWISPTLS